MEGRLNGSDYFLLTQLTFRSIKSFFKQKLKLTDNTYFRNLILNKKENGLKFCESEVAEMFIFKSGEQKQKKYKIRKRRKNERRLICREKSIEKVISWSCVIMFS
jgi:hypothetical protein